MIVGWRRWRLVSRPSQPANSTRRRPSPLRLLRYPTRLEQQHTPPLLAPSPTPGQGSSPELFLVGMLGGVWSAPRLDAVCGFVGSSPPQDSQLRSVPGLILPAPSPHPNLPAPDPDCSCGVYAARHLSHPELADLDVAGVVVSGQVTLGGTVLEHRLGFRASSAVLLGPLLLSLPPHLLDSEWAQAVASLLRATYDVDVEFTAVL